MLALIDGDICAYRAAAATQKSLDFGDGGSVYARPEEAARAAVDTVNFWALGAGCTKIMVFLSGSLNFRKLIYPHYKANRSGIERPVALKATQEALKDAFKTVVVEGLEADDLMGLTLSNPRMQGAAVCVTMDKDLKTVPGLHYNPSKDAFPGLVTEAEANRIWMTQTLTGDATDNYGGCPKIGPVKATKLLAGWSGVDLLEGWEIVKGAFESAKAHAVNSNAITMARLARILRHGDYDKDKREVRLWGPETTETLALPG